MKKVSFISILVIIIILAVRSCINQPKFIPIKKLDKFRDDICFEYILISNPPSDLKELKKIVLKYHKENPIKIGCDRYVRNFIKQHTYDVWGDHNGYLSENPSDLSLEDRLYKIVRSRDFKGEYKVRHTIYKDGFSVR